MIQWQKFNIFAQIKINLSWEMFLDYQSETQTLLLGQGDESRFWGENSNTDWPLAANVAYKPLHYLKYFTSWEEKKRHYMLHVKEQTLLLSTHWCAPIALTQIQNGPSLSLDLELSLLSSVSLYLTSASCWQNQTQDVSQLHYHFLQDSPLSYTCSLL